MEKHRCYKHGEYYGSFCRQCEHEESQKRSDEISRRLDEEARHRDEERWHDEELSAAEDRQADLIQAQKDLAYRIANPGDYDCPRCGFKTLKLNAQACPKCHRDVPVGYWEPINRDIEQRRQKAERERRERAAQEQERRQRDAAEAERKRIEWERTAPEREARGKEAARRSAQEEYQRKRQDEQRHRANQSFWLFIIVLVPTAIIYAAYYSFCYIHYLDNVSTNKACEDGLEVALKVLASTALLGLWNVFLRPSSHPRPN